MGNEVFWFVTLDPLAAAAAFGGNAKGQLGPLRHGEAHLERRSGSWAYQASAQENPRFEYPVPSGDEVLASGPQRVGGFA